MKLITTLSLLTTLLIGVEARGKVYSIWVNGVDQGFNTGLRTPPGLDYVQNLTSTNIACGANGQIPAANFIEVNAGDEITAEWYKFIRGDVASFPSYMLGPVLAYIAPYSDNALGFGWTKIYEDGTINGTAHLKENSLLQNVTLPQELAPGDYLVRYEFIALQEAYTTYENNRARGAQLYPNCAQIRVLSGGTVSSPPNPISLPGGYTYTYPSILFDIYNNKLDTYSPPGGALWT